MPAIITEDPQFLTGIIGLTRSQWRMEENTRHDVDNLTIITNTSSLAVILQSL